MKKTLALFGLSFALCASASADIVAGWNPQGFGTVGNPFPEAFEATTQIDHLLGTPTLTRGSGFSAASLNNGWGGQYSASATGIDLDAARAQNLYLGFSMTPADGYALSLSSVGLQLRMSSAIFTRGVSIAWEYSIDGRSFNVVPGSALAINTTTTGAYDTNGQIIPNLDLTQIGDLQNITSSVEFRLYFYASGDGNNNQNISVSIGRSGGNDLVFNGSLAAIPEPSTYAALFGLGGLGMIFLRGLRYRKQK